MSLRVGILGASGYGGGELLRLLSGHPKVDAIQPMSRRNVGSEVSSVHPNLAHLFTGTFVEKVNWDWLANGETPVLFSAIPHGELAKRYEGFAAEWEAVGLSDRLTVIDLSADFRVGPLDLYEKHYGRPHPCPDRVKDWTYALPEWNRDAIAGARRLANPGCFATALQIGLLPILQMPGVEYVAATGITGSSGSGMEPSDTTHHPTRSNDFRAYKMLRHQHMAEVEQLLRWRERELEISFVPHSAPLVRGILVTLQFQSPEPHALKDCLSGCYASSRFIRNVGTASPRVGAVAGSNFADVGWSIDGNNCAVLVAIDNLMKGMAGQAVQNMNLALGFDEAEGLWFAGGFPY